LPYLFPLIHNLLYGQVTWCFGGVFSTGSSNLNSTLYLIFQALEQVTLYHEQVHNLKTQESTLRRGLNIFKIEQAPSKDLQGLEKDLEHLEQMWTITKEWEGLWDTWKVGRFVELVTTEMETTSQLLYKRLNKTIREVRVKLPYKIKLKLLNFFFFTFFLFFFFSSHFSFFLFLIFFFFSHVFDFIVLWRSTCDVIVLLCLIG
jgi:hypothetical protein